MPDEVAKLKTFTRQSSQRTNRRFSLPYCNFLWQGFVFFSVSKVGGYTFALASLSTHPQRHDLLRNRSTCSRICTERTQFRLLSVFSRSFTVNFFKRAQGMHFILQKTRLRFVCRKKILDEESLIHLPFS